jgi:hypothetical protein
MQDSNRNKRTATCFADGGVECGASRIGVSHWSHHSVFGHPRSFWDLESAATS